MGAQADPSPPVPSSPEENEPLVVRVPLGSEPRVRADLRPEASGKFLFVGDGKLFVRGVTYGTFRPRAGADGYPQPEVVERDFALMAETGINAIRTYTPPPRWVLDAALRHGLRVMVGLAWEQHVAFLDERQRVRSIVDRVRAGVRASAGHPAVLCYAVGSEIPASIVRWYGSRRIERFLERLCDAAREEDPDGLVTYVNYPTTEYLDLPFLDLVSFNVFLESTGSLEGYLARLHHVAGDRPLIVTELGLDSRRHGEEAQAHSLAEQVRCAFASGSAGAFVFSWTDEWHRGGYEVEDWAFGITRRDRTPKPALRAVRDAFEEVPFPSGTKWPRISVVVCSYNGERTIGECLEAATRLDYPDYEVIVVDDGSADRTAEIARRWGVRVISTENRGLASARNTGLEAATGDIVAYVDDDAYPDRHWLAYLAWSFLTSDRVGIGGPNLPPPGDGPVADSVANAPGGPMHVLLSDTEAEHIPGCNMAFRREALLAIGGFDPRFRTAGDDVDICWRLQGRGGKIGFSPAAVVWHHRRGSVRTFWRQQLGYGRAEALLEEKWPARYNRAGHVSWSGRIYGGTVRRRARNRIYQGVWGQAPFQFATGGTPSVHRGLVTTPEWLLVIAALALLAVLGAQWDRLRVAIPLLAAAVLVPLADGGLAAARARLPRSSAPLHRRLWMRGLTGLLHLLHPAARLWGRVAHGLTPWRRHARARVTLPRRRRFVAWSEQWRSPEEWLRSVEARIRPTGMPVARGGPYDRWDLEVRGGTLGSALLRMGIEEHGRGRQLLRFRVWPRWPRLAWVLAAGAGALSAAAATDGAYAAAGILGAGALTVPVLAAWQSGAAMGSVAEQLPGDGPGP